MTFRRAALLTVVASLAAMLAACSSSSSSTTPPISVAFTSGFTPPTSMTIGATAGIAATITNGSQSATVNWSCAPASQCGSFSPTSTASTDPTTYTAPTTVPSGGTVTITATSGSATVSATITITSNISLAFTSGFTPPASLGTSATANIAVTITNGPPSATVNWTVTCGSAQCGSFNPTSTASTVQTTYTAPATIPTGGTVTITATSANDSSKSLSATITITQSAVSVTFTPGSTPPTSMLIAGTANIAATVTGDSGNAGVNWSCTPASQCGSFNPTHTASGSTTVYTAPTSVPSGASVTVTATSADSSASVSATITIGSSITVAFSSTPPASVLIDSNTSITANVSGDPNSAGVNWSCTPATLCGTFTPASTASGAATQYSAPAAVPAGNTVTVTAASITDSTKSASATITVTSNITVAFTSGFAPPSSLNTDIQARIAATVTGDPGNAGVNWTVTCGSAGQCGSFNPAQTDNSVPTTYTSPVNVPTGNTVTVTATAISDFNKTISGTITITQPSPTLPDGTYVFQLSGQDSNVISPFNVVGAFTVVSGAITGGEQDFVDAEGPGSDQFAADSTITPTTDGSLQIVLDTGDSDIGVGGNGLETLNLTLVAPNGGPVTWFDGFAAGTGTITAQDTTAAKALPQNGYAFLTSGYDIYGYPTAIGGIVNVDNGSGTGNISGAGSVFDINDPGYNNGVGMIEQDQSFSNFSSVAGGSGGTKPDQYGKVVFTLVPTGASGVRSFNLAGYIIDANSIALVESNDLFGGTTGGTALAQGSSNTGKFGTANLSGFSYVVGAQGQDPNFFLNFVGALTFNSDLSVSGTTDFNDLTLQSSGAITGGTYSVDASGTGRATIINLAGTDLNLASGSATLQVYLDGNGNALVASMDINDVAAGPAFQQTSGASLSGKYALGAIGVSGQTADFWSAAGPINISGGAIGSSSFTDFNYFDTPSPSVLAPDVPLTGTVSSSSSITGLGADSIATPPLTSDTFDFYVIDSLRAFGIETDNTQLGLLYLQQPPAPKAHAKTRK
ncbi:MAG: hypothetical protein WCC04_07650 [Terriglobales bacterium]